MFFKKNHNLNIYNKLLFLSRNIFFYKVLSLKDTFETRVFLMFIHYSIILIIYKKKKKKIDQENYNNLFYCIENNLRELGFGDISVNKKMKDLNKYFYDILLKINVGNNEFRLNKKLISKYFEILSKNQDKTEKFEVYLKNFYNFCFEISANNMIDNIEGFKFNYGSS